MLMGFTEWTIMAQRCIIKGANYKRIEKNGKKAEYRNKEHPSRPSEMEPLDSWFSELAFVDFSKHIHIIYSSHTCI